MSLDDCVDLARKERVIVTRNGKPIALLTSVEGLDEEQIELGTSQAFWTMIAERRAQPTMSRDELHRRLEEKRQS